MKKVTQNKLDTLECYGALSSLPTKWIQQMYERLERIGFLKHSQITDDYQYWLGTTVGTDMLKS